MNLASRHFKRHRERNPLSFFWRMTLEGLAISMVAAAILSLLGTADRHIPAFFSIPAMFVLVVIVFPVVETVLLQMMPIELMRFMKVGFNGQVAVSTVIFFLLHALEGIGAGVVAGLVGGFYFAFMYAHLRDIRFWTALWMTAGSHAVQNCVAFVGAILAGEMPLAQ